MKVAEAMTPIARTLRPGRSDALRNPRRHTGREPCPSSDERGGRRSTNPTPLRHATSSEVPAPKNPAVRSSVPTNASARSVAPIVAKKRRQPEGLGPDHRRPVERRPGAPKRRGRGGGSIRPASRLRSEIRARPRSVHQMHTIAAIERAGCPGGQRQRRHVQAQRGGADRSGPPRPQPGHHHRAVRDGAGGPEKAADEGEHASFGSKTGAARARR